MKRILFLPLLLCTLLSMAQNQVTVTPVSPLSDAVSGHYAGWLNGALSTYGGCNFPDVPCADGGQKVYYPKAYGASVQVPGGVVYLGGMNTDGSISECEFLNAADGTATSIISLPKPLDNFAATYYDGMLWVAGGQSNGVPNQEVYALPFPSESKAWSVAATLPDACRLQPCVAVQNTAAGYSLFIFGGYQPKAEGQEAMVHTDGVYMTIAELKKGITQWTRTAPTLVNVNINENKDNLSRLKSYQSLKVDLLVNCVLINFIRLV